MFTDRLKKYYWTAGMPHLIFGCETELETGWYPSGDCYVPVSAFVRTGEVAREKGYQEEVRGQEAPGNEAFAARHQPALGIKVFSAKAGPCNCICPCHDLWLEGGSGVTGGKNTHLRYGEWMCEIPR
jgi:hypothetical protein